MSAEKPMNLGATLRQLEKITSEDSSHQRRRFARFPARGQAVPWPGEAVTGVEPLGTFHLRDISRSGVGLLSNKPAEPGQFWRLNLGDERVIVASLPAVCRHCRQVDDGAYLIGAEFGVDASVLLAVGVPAKAIALGDEPEAQRAVVGDYVDPASLNDDAE